MTLEIEKMKFLMISINKYPDVKFEFSNPINAAREVLKLKPKKLIWI